MDPALEAEEGPPSTATRQVLDVLVTLEDEQGPNLFRQATISRAGETVARVHASQEGFTPDDDLVHGFAEGDSTVVVLLETESFPRKTIRVWRTAPGFTRELEPIEPMVISFIEDVDGDGRLELGGAPNEAEASTPEGVYVLEIGQRISEDPKARDLWLEKGRSAARPR